MSGFKPLVTSFFFFFFFLEKKKRRGITLSYSASCEKSVRMVGWVLFVSEVDTGKQN